MKILTMVIALIIFLAHLTVMLRAFDFYLRSAHNMKTIEKHGATALKALIVMGIAISLFRVLQTVETRAIKYMHAILHVTVCVLIYYSLVKLNYIEWHYMHGFPAYIVFYSYLIQIALALLIFVALPVGKIRDSVSIVHSITGVWLYHCFVGIAISGWHTCNRLYEGEYRLETNKSGVESDGCLLLLDHFKSLLIVGAFILNFLLLFPYFQWEFVGSL